MNKKLIITAMAVALTASCAQATNITGVSASGSNIYNITPEHYSGNAAYRKYDNFVLDKGHVANLDFADRNGVTTNTFVNLVGNQVQINGLLNSVKNGNFYNGHAVFITPGGFVVGASGVLNVGKVSVATPTSDTYNNKLLKYNNKDFGDADFDYANAIGRRISKLTQNSDSSLPAGAADITVQGMIFTRNGAEMTGKNVNISGNVVNGLKDNSSVLSTEAQAKAMFDNLVNTNGLMVDNYKENFVQNGSRILIKSTNGIDVSGSVNNGAGNVYLTNNGASGLNVSGAVDAHSLARLYSTKGDLSLSDNATVLGRNDSAVIQNKGANLTLGKNTTVESYKTVEVLNQGSGRLTASGNIYAGRNSAGGGGHITLLNQGSGMTVEGNISNNMSTKAGELAINNEKGDLIVNGKIQNNGNMGIINTGSGATITKNAVIENKGKLKIANTGSNGLTVVGDITNSNGDLRIYNDGGALKFTTSEDGTKAASVKNSNGNLYVVARKNGTGISQSSAAEFVNVNGNIAIRNSGTKTVAGTRGLDLQGKVKATNGIVAINNDYGDMYVSSNVEVTDGNLGIINRASGGKMTVASSANITVTNGSLNKQSNTNIKNYGLGNMEVNGTITHTGRVNILANAGALNLGATVHNNSGALSDNGGFYAAARQNGTGVNVTSSFVVDGNGEVLIKNISGEDGLRYNGTINTENHQAALVNHKGNMEVSGKITTKKAPIIISNKGNKLTILNSTQLNSGTEGTIANSGSEAMTVGNSATINNMKKYQKVKK